MTTQTALASLVVVAFTVGAEAQKVALTEDDVRVAITTGARAREKPRPRPRDSAQAWASLDKNASTGFWVEVYTPTTWLMRRASNAPKKYQVMDPAAPVAPELLEPVFRVIAHPDMPNTVSKSGMTGTASVEHVILRDEQRKS